MPQLPWGARRDTPRANRPQMDLHFEEVKVLTADRAGERKKHIVQTRTAAHGSSLTSFARQGRKPEFRGHLQQRVGKPGRSKQDGVEQGSHSEIPQLLRNTADTRNHSCCAHGINAWDGRGFAFEWDWIRLVNHKKIRRENGRSVSNVRRGGFKHERNRGLKTGVSRRTSTDLMFAHVASCTITGYTQRRPRRQRSSQKARPSP